MGDKTGIEWSDATWNPIVGCSKVSPGCANCYAEDQHRRLLNDKHGYPPFKPWTPKNAEHNVTLMRRKLEQPLRWTKPRMVFVNSMSDLFHEQVPVEYIAEVFAVMALAPQHTFQVLTKRPEWLQQLLTGDHGFFWPLVSEAMFNRLDRAPMSPAQATIILNHQLPNVWVGVSIENRRFVDRADLLRETPAAVRFISAEPLLGPLTSRCGDCDGTGCHPYGDGGDRCFTCNGSGQANGGSLDLTDIDWLIAGGESGPGHRPIKSEWVRDLRDACMAIPSAVMSTTAGSDDGSFGPPGFVHGTAFFFKQWGGPTPKSNGRELDGRTWDEMPAVLA